MGRYVTPAGVVIEMSDHSALAVGYKAEARQPDAVDDQAKRKRKPGRPRKSE